MYTFTALIPPLQVRTITDRFVYKVHRLQEVQAQWGPVKT